MLIATDINTFMLFYKQLFSVIVTCYRWFISIISGWRVLWRSFL